jgi:serine/threonine protein kinase
MIGQILGERYEVRQQLGKKPGRQTLVAWDKKTQLADDLVIIKLLSFGSDFEWNNLKLFEREGKTLKSLSHPSIPLYLDYFEVNLPAIRGFALVQTYIPALTLEQHLNSGRTFTESEVKTIAQSVLEILLYLHGQNPPIIHRDIKPSNILLGNSSDGSVGQIYLVDFGSVQTVLNQESGTRTVVGTYGYMPPEQFGDRATPASDFYSLGATLIYLVTGTHPTDLPQKDFRIQFEQVANLSPTFTYWLKWMTQPTLERRFKSATEALEALNDGHRRTSRLAIAQPFGSKIQLTKHQDYLEILIPSEGFNQSILFAGLFAIAWNSFILFWTISALVAPYPWNLLLLLFSLPFWGAGFLILRQILFSLFGSTYFKINSQHIEKVTHFPIQLHRPKTFPRQNITKLVYNPKHFSQNTDGVAAELNICAGVEKCVLGDVVKSEIELEWLANELSDWLNLPMAQE